MTQPDPGLLGIFAAEQAEHLQLMRSQLDRLGTSAECMPAVEGLLRSTHTLKGASRAVGLDSTEILTHALEGALTAVRARSVPASPRIRSVLSHSLDLLEDILAARLSNRAEPDSATLLREIGSISMEAPPIALPEAHPAATAPVPGKSAEFIRVKAADLDDLMRASFELVAAVEGTNSPAEAASQSEIAAAGLRKLRERAAAWVQKYRNSQDSAPVFEYLQESERLIEALLEETRRRDRSDWEFRRLAAWLDERALRVRMVDAETVFGAFGPMLRSLAHEHGKEIEYQAEGLELPADRLVLQSLKNPVMHLLRNALAHGIEMENERMSMGKTPAGNIRLIVRSLGERLQVTVEDDGRGMDQTVMVREAARRGIAPVDTGEFPHGSVLENLIFQPGFSTATLSTLSGRGMGLSIVRDEVARLQGEIRVSSVPRKGSKISISVPLSLSSQQVLLLNALGHQFGILTSCVEQLLRVEKSLIRTVEGKPAVLLNSLPLRLVRLTDLLNLRTPGPYPALQEDDRISIAVIAAGESKIALAVDRLVEVREAVIKPIGLASGRAGFSAGAIPLSDGSVAVILDAAELTELSRNLTSVADTATVDPAPKKEADTILVVDDSLTTRSLEKSLLEANGYRVEVAVDGVDGLEKLRARKIDLVITDLMMPRMDGFELLEQIRADRTLSKTPVIIVSSMDSRSDQERGLALGADAWVVKQKFDQGELLAMVRRIL